MEEIEINGVIGSWDVDAGYIVEKIKSAKGDIKILLNSTGGSVVDGFSIYEALNTYDKGDITIEIGAVAASIASYIAMAGDHIIAKTNSVFMIHNAWMPTVGDFIKLRKAADISEGLSSIIARAYIAKTGKNEKKIKEMMNEETFFYGIEIKDGGFADEILDLEADDTTKAEAMSLVLENLKACNNAVVEHSSYDEFAAAAKLIKPKEKRTEEIKTVALNAKQLRDIQIFEREVKI